MRPNFRKLCRIDGDAIKSSHCNLRTGYVSARTDVVQAYSAKRAETVTQEQAREQQVVHYVYIAMR
eukprot:SAG31_NODE_874_length_11319_cov_3.145098_10_plen_66_part_00